MQKVEMTQEDRAYFKKGVKTLCGKGLCRSTGDINRRYKKMNLTAVAITGIICITLIIITAINKKNDKNGKE